ncbi:MFS transporter [Candidatus Gottesmanbacteria bacterium]|nr:MFS transporter [Candidatus Gottesmanbacteria bacterium]
MSEHPFSEVVLNKHFRNLWLAQIFSQVAVNMLSFVLAIRVYQETQSNTAVSLLFLTFGIPSIIFGVFAGGIVDYFDKRSILFWCNVVRLLLFLGFFLFASNIFFLYILAISFSLVTQIFIPAEAPAIPNLVPKKNLLAANSLFTISFYLSTITGFVVAGPILRIFGGRDVYVFMTVLMGCASFFAYLLPKMVVKRTTLPLTFSSLFKGVDDGITFIGRNVRVRQSLILMTFAQSLIMTLSVLTPGFADKILSIDLTESSYIVMGPAVIGLVSGALFIGGYGMRFLKGTLILFGILFTGIILLCLSLLTRFDSSSYTLAFPNASLVIGTIFPVMILLFLLGMMNSFITVPANTILQQDSSGGIRGRVYGVLTALTGGVSIIPVVFSGLLADTIGVGKTLTLVGGIVFVSGIYHYFQRQRYKVMYSKKG